MEYDYDMFPGDRCATLITSCESEWTQHRIHLGEEDIRDMIEVLQGCLGENPSVTPAEIPSPQDIEGINPDWKLRKVSLPFFGCFFIQAWSEAEGKWVHVRFVR